MSSNNWGEPWFVDYDVPTVEREACTLDWIISNDPERSGQAGICFDGFLERRNIERAVTCVNACRGLPDPEAAIGRLVEAAEELREAALAWADSTPSDRRISEIQMALSADKLGVAVAPFLAAREGRDRG